MKRRRLSILLILVISCLLIFSCINAYGFELSAIEASASRENDADDTEDCPNAQLHYTGAVVLIKVLLPFLEHDLLRFRSSFSFPSLPILFSASSLRC